MATRLDKKLVRESTFVVDEREVMVTLTADQKIELKLKGLKSGVVSISIEDLWNQLNDSDDSKGDSTSIDSTHPKANTKGNPMISLHDLRTYNAISTLDYNTIVKFEEIIKNLMDNYSEKYGKYSKKK